jgi:hypothetical protein
MLTQKVGSQTRCESACVAPCESFSSLQDLDESFSSLSRLGCVIFKSLETWMRVIFKSLKIGCVIFKSLEIGCVIFKSLKIGCVIFKSSRLG